MSLIEQKPFSFDQMIRRVLFQGRPSYFNAIDLNKELDIIHNYMEEISSRFAVSSDISFSFNSLESSIDGNKYKRLFAINWFGTHVLHNGVKYSIQDGGTNHSTQYTIPNNSNEPVPNSYVILRGELNRLGYSQNPELCGLQSVDGSRSVPSVEIEQWSSVSIEVTDDPTSVDNLICILATLHPRYRDGIKLGYGLIINTFENPTFDLVNSGVAKSTLVSNGTLYEYLIEKEYNKYSELVNKRQLIREYNLADLTNPSHARTNIGLDKVFNQPQLLRDANLTDLTNVPLARQALGLGVASTYGVGTDASSLSRGDSTPIGTIIMFWGDLSRIPDCYVVCDGSNGTPDLRGRFPVGADSNNNDYTVGVKKGVESVTLTESQSGLRKHKHPIYDPGHSHLQDTAVIGRGYETRADDTPLGRNISSDTSMSTTNISVLEVDGLDALEPHENRPPYLALTFLMFIGYPNSTPPNPIEVPNINTPNYSSPTTDSLNEYRESNFTQTSTLGAGVYLTNPR